MRLATAALAVLGALAAVGPAPTPATAVEEDRFLLTGHFQLRVGDELQRDARIYKLASGAPKILLLGEELPDPMLLTAGERTAQPVDAGKIAFPEGEPHVAIVPRDAVGRAAPAKVTGRSLYFNLPEGRRGIVEPKDPIVGQMSIEQMLDELPEFSRNLETYEPNVGQLRLLSSAEDAKVHVFFGTWCRHCEKIVPRLIKVVQALEGDGVDVTFHAVPEKISDDPLARRLRVSSVPTALVTRSTLSPRSVIARLRGSDLKRPERALTAALFGGG